MRDELFVIRATFLLVHSMIPPLIEFGIVNKTDCIELGAVIGTVVAVERLHRKYYACGCQPHEYN
ncbi:MAG: hypothetical protein IID42_02945 [Planctomycetes bacterium]|nr:hypothetical protein [Planctomycetota bacterium]